MPVPRRPSSTPRSRRETVTGHLVARQPAAPVPVLLHPGSPTHVARLVVAAVVHAVEAVARTRARAELPQDSTSIPVRDDARREGLEAPTARSVAWCSASIWSVPDGSDLLRWDGSSVASGPDGSSRIVWMIIGMIKPPGGTATTASRRERMAAEWPYPPGPLPARDVCSWC
jgi:hypothetical protein